MSEMFVTALGYQEMPLFFSSENPKEGASNPRWAALFLREWFYEAYGDNPQPQQRKRPLLEVQPGLGSLRVPEKTTDYVNCSATFCAHLQFAGLRVLGGTYSLWDRFKIFSVQESFSSPWCQEERLNRCWKQQQTPLWWQQYIVQWLGHLRGFILRRKMLWMLKNNAAT